MKNNLKIGFYLRWNVGSLTSSRGNVVGDELYATSLAAELSRLGNIDADVYAPNKLPADKLDFMIYLNDSTPRSEWANKSVLYMQNGYGNGSYETLSQLRSNKYAGYAFISNKLLELHRNDGYRGLFLPFGVDTKYFYPRPHDISLAYDVSYVGNDIKGADRSKAYLEPALSFNFGLYGNWNISPRKFLHRLLPSSYKRKFERISRGKIPQEYVPILYSSSKVNLNCTLQDCVDWDVITLRTLEILACDGFIISDRVPSAEKLLGNFMVFTDGYEDLEAKICYYIDHENERQSLAKSGGDYVRKNFSIEATAQVLVNYLLEL